MLISFKVKNCFLFDKEIVLSMAADKHVKRFADNCTEIDGCTILKSAIILGPNNAGKTNLTRCFRAIRNIMLDCLKPYELASNYFTTSDIGELTVRFTYEDKQYVFEVRYDTRACEFVYERLAVSGPKGELRDIYMRDLAHHIYLCDSDRDLENILPHVAKNNILIYLLDSDKFEVLAQAKRAIREFASSIDVVDMNRISLGRTLNAMKHPDQAQKIREFVLDADLSLDDFRLEGNRSRGLVLNDVVAERIDPWKIAGVQRDAMRLVSVYGDQEVPSIVMDSRGTQTIEAIAAYVIDALEEHRILVIDELDSSLHFALTRAIVALFNNEANESAQLIATTHDPTLLDCRKLFRQEQIWFSHKDRDGVYLYSLADFKSRKNGVRADTSDLIAKYKAGVFGALPDPDLFPLLLELSND